MRIGLYPGTFDPVTLGHMDIIRRGAKLVDKLVIGVTTNPSKSPLFSAGSTARHGAARMRGHADGDRAWWRSTRCSSISPRGRSGRAMILRGLRAVADFEYEYQMAGMNQYPRQQYRDGLPAWPTWPSSPSPRAWSRRSPISAATSPVRHAGGSRRRAGADRRRRKPRVSPGRCTFSREGGGSAR